MAVGQTLLLPQVRTSIDGNDSHSRRLYQGDAKELNPLRSSTISSRNAAHSFRAVYGSRLQSPCARCSSCICTVSRTKTPDRCRSNLNRQTHRVCYSENRGEVTGVLALFDLGCCWNMAVSMGGAWTKTDSAQGLIRGHVM
jgi:hypothetical protein